MKLYDGGKAPNPRRVQIFLAEKGIEIAERVPVDLNAMGHKSDEITQKNPLQRVPMLELDDGTVISESIAICRYFEETHPDPALFGVDPVDRAMVEMWQRRLEMHYLLPVAQAFRHLHPGGAHLEGAQVAQWGEINQARALEFMEILDKQLENSAFVAGKRYSVADITGIVTTQFLKPARLEIPETLVHLRRWFADMLIRPSTAW